MQLFPGIQQNHFTIDGVGDGFLPETLAEVQGEPQEVESLLFPVLFFCMKFNHLNGFPPNRFSG